MNTRLFVTIATAALILAGCANDENGTDNGPVKIRLTSGVEVQQPRASTTLTQSTSITAGEVVSVWVDDAGTMSDPTPLYKANQLTATAQNGFSGSDMFFPETGNKVNIYAVHGKFSTPFTGGEAFPDAGVEFSVAADQSTAGGKAYTNSDLLYAYEKEVARSNSPVQLTFYHMLSKLELAIVKGEGAPELAATGAVKLGDVTLKGNFTPSTSADMSDQSQRAGMLTAISSQGVSGDMTLGQTTCEDFTNAKVSYNEAILVPQDMKDKVLTFTLADGGTLKYTIPEFTSTGAAIFESGKKYQYHITLNLTGLTVTSTIEDWAAVGPVPGKAEMD